jgi:hypothetical protein
MNFLYDEFRTSPYYIDDPLKACLFVAFLQSGDDVDRLSEWNQTGRNHLLLIDNNFGSVDSGKFGAAIVVSEKITNYRHKMDMELFLDVEEESVLNWMKLPFIVPYHIKVCTILFKSLFFQYLISYQTRSTLPSFIKNDLIRLSDTAPKSLDTVLFDLECTFGSDSELCGTKDERCKFLIYIFSILHPFLVKVIRNSAFTLIFDSQPYFQRRFREILEGGSIPVILSTGNFHLPFEEQLDWRQACVKLPLARLTELHFILRSFTLNDRLEMRRKGRFLFENYLLNSKGTFKKLLNIFYNLNFSSY